MNAATLPTKVRNRIAVDAAGCWIWLGRRNDAGYGVIDVRAGTTRGPRRAHRIVYETLRGPIPDGLDLDHICRVRHCVNPVHLEPVTRGENTRRGLQGALKTTCPRGHALAGDNLGIHRRADGRQSRRCLQCHRDRERAHRLNERGGA